MRRPAVVLLFVLVVAAVFSTPASAQLSQLMMEDMRLLYFDATQGYLAPHVARCFVNSFEFQREFWGWEPAWLRRTGGYTMSRFRTSKLEDHREKPPVRTR